MLFKSLFCNEPETGPSSLKEINLRGFKVCMFVYNNFKHDTRVIKEAKTLIGAGYQVTVIALADQDSELYEEKDGIRVIRVIKSPISQKILNAIYTFNPLKIIENKIFKKIRNHGLEKQKTEKKTDLWSNITNQFIKQRNRFTNQRIENEWLIAQEKGIREYWKIKQENQGFSLFSISILILLLGLIYMSVQKIWILFRKIWYWGVKRPLKKIWYWGVKRPLKKIWYWGVKRPLKILLRRYIYRAVKKILISIHRPLCFLDFHYKSLDVVAKEKADIYHAHDLNVLAAAYQAAKKYEGKLVYDSHEFYVERNRQSPHHPVGKFLLKKFEHFLIQRCDAVITVSDSIAEELAIRYQVNLPTVILNTPPLKEFKKIIDPTKSIRSELSINPALSILLYSGGITFNRGIEKVIESLVYLPNCCLVLMGYGKEDYIQKIQDLAVQLQVESRLFTFGPVLSDQVTSYAASADLGIAAIQNVCLSYYYCLPNKLFEYVFSQIPVIASNFPEMSKIINNYHIGGTFDPDQPEDIARAVNEVLTSQQIEKIQENISAVVQCYNWENQSQKLIQLYQKLN